MTTLLTCSSLLLMFCLGFKLAKHQDAEQLKHAKNMIAALRHAIEESMTTLDKLR